MLPALPDDGTAGGAARRRPASRPRPLPECRRAPAARSPASLGDAGSRRWRTKGWALLQRLRHHAVVASRAMTQPLSRRELLATAGAGFALAATAGQRSVHAEALTGGIKITMPVGELTDENLSFVAYLG